MQKITNKGAYAMSGFTISKNIIIKTTPTVIWDALTNPEIVKEYMFGCEVISNWQVGGSLIYRGTWQGKAFEDKGIILEIEPDRLLKTTYYSALSGLEDTPENYNVVTYEITPTNDATRLTIKQDNIRSQESADHSAQSWEGVLKTIKQLLEK